MMLPDLPVRAGAKSTNSSNSHHPHLAVLDHDGARPQRRARVRRQAKPAMIALLSKCELRGLEPTHAMSCVGVCVVEA